jgi:hypothetical protein
MGCSPLRLEVTKKDQEALDDYVSVLEESEKQRIIAMVCAAPPEGHTRWTVRLVAGHALKERLDLLGQETGGEVWDRITEAVS